MGDAYEFAGALGGDGGGSAPPPPGGASPSPPPPPGSAPPPNQQGTGGKPPLPVATTPRTQLAKKKPGAPGSAKKRVKKKVPEKREIMGEGDTVQSELHTWRVVKLLGSGGFGDVYKVVKHNDPDKTESAMKTEMVIGDRRMLRLKIEVLVLMKCHEQPDPNNKQHFVAFVDRGKTAKFKFLVMGLVWKSLEDIRRDILGHNYSRSTVVQCSIQTLIAVRDLHGIGYLHREALVLWDIKPQNYAAGLGEHQSTIYMLDFGIARKYTIGETKELKLPRAKVSFLGTVRFASRACHKQIEQGRKDDLESWIFMVFELFDDAYGLPWKRADRTKVVPLKEKFFKNQIPRCYKVVPADFKRIVEYIDGMKFADEPDYVYILNSLNSIAKENKIDLNRKLDWIGVTPKVVKKKRDRTEVSSDNRQSGSESGS
nr:Serine threonine protein kinase-related domain containing protein [Haemonchus contortus]